MKSASIEFAGMDIQAVAEKLGSDIRIARKRRKETQIDFAKRCHISKPTLIAIEKGALTPSIGSYLMVLKVLGMLNDVGDLAAPEKDAFGNAIAEADLPQRIRNKKVIDNDF